MGRCFGDIRIARSLIAILFEKKISEHFQIGSDRDLSWFLKLKIERTENKILLSQQTNVEKLVEKLTWVNQRY